MTTAQLNALVGGRVRGQPRGATAPGEHPCDVVRIHGKRVGQWCEAVARELGLSASHAARLGLAGELHDIGKWEIPDSILLKPGKLTPSEWARVRMHPADGAELLASFGLDDIAEWVLLHHERPDGCGYPLGLTAEQIPIEARILAVADAFDAMTSERSYQPALPVSEAVAELDAGCGTQFDSDVIAAMLRVV
jgi:HD-GYP domain-containing protein (c-di-GMP phosphodiesterase class II)